MKRRQKRCCTETQESPGLLKVQEGNCLAGLMLCNSPSCGRCHCCVLIAMTFVFLPGHRCSRKSGRQRTAEVAARHTGWVWCLPAFRLQVEPMGSTRITQGSALPWQAGRSNSKPFSFSQSRAECEARLLQLSCDCLVSKRPFNNEMCSSLSSGFDVFWAGQRTFCGSMPRAVRLHFVCSKPVQTRDRSGSVGDLAPPSRHQACSHHPAERTSAGLYPACGPQNQ